ncbi:MAG: coniferyl aldehyde dehydrogenase [Desulfotignum sp.]|nr:coniferyl aldehyde dehydrogenase [Desulfotignum sp.]
MIQSNPSATEPDAEALEIYTLQTRSCLEQPEISLKQRLALLKTIEDILTENDQAICEAVNADFGNRCFHETRILEISPCLMGLRYTRKRIKKWMTPQRRHVSLVFPGGRNRVIPQAKGVVGIITPWNYPLFLAISPMTCALAAGNRVMVKQAAHSQHLCRLLCDLFSKKIGPAYVRFLPGVSASAFSGLPFNHLVFTGSPRTGKTVMETAARHLVPVTLELGGKSPVILADDFDMATAVKRILFAKLMNAGQTCIAPDYIFVPENRIDEFIGLARTEAARLFPEISSPDYTAIIDHEAFARLTDTLADVKNKGGRVINLLDGPDTLPELKKISPVIVTEATPAMRIMQEEIFGPILPVLAYTSLKTVIDYINDRPRPLALYVFTRDRKLSNTVIAHTRSGGVTVNDCALHAVQHDLPFGGTGNSGMGHYHGIEGFLEFSKLRPVFRQAPLSVSSLLTPPYGRVVNRVFQMIRHLSWLS